MKQIEIYKNEDGVLELALALQGDTVWLSQAQMVLLFGRDKSVISRHIRNIFKEDELIADSVVAKYATTTEDGKVYQVDHYNLDVIISVGYRVKSKQGVRFRQWATARLKDYLIKGYAINQQRFEQNSNELEQALTLINKALNNPEIAKNESQGLAEIVSRYTLVVKNHPFADGNKRSGAFLFVDFLYRNGHLYRDNH